MKILFQGDSITDGNRCKELSYRWDLNHQIGHSYVFHIAGRLGAEYPGHYTIVNRGVSGETVSDLAVRWDTDALSENPDLLSVFIGTNDASRTPPQGLSLWEWYENNFREILNRSLVHNPSLKLVILEPFTLRFAVYRQESDAEYARRRAIYSRLQEAAARIAEDFGAVYIPLQEMFDSLPGETNTDSTYWMWDGIHPTEAGHWKIAEKWLQCTAHLL